MGGACSAYGCQESCIQGHGENLRERDHWRDLGVLGRIILNGSSGSRICGCGVDRGGSG